METQGRRREAQAVVGVMCPMAPSPQEKGKGPSLQAPDCRPSLQNLQRTDMQLPQGRSSSWEMSSMTPGEGGKGGAGGQESESERERKKEPVGQGAGGAEEGAPLPPFI